MKRIVLYLGAIVTSCYIFVCSSEPSNEAPSGGGGDCGCSSTSRETYTAGATAAGGAVDQQSRTLLDVVEALIDVDAGAASVASSAAGSGELPFSEMVYIPGGTFLMGTNKPMIPYDYEGPAREVAVHAFYLDKYEVSNAAFKRFVDATGYKTESESFGWSFVMDSTAIPPSVRASIQQAVLGSEWWLPVPQAYWYQPEGEGSHVFTDTGLPGWIDRSYYPVSQVSWNDAVAFCKWRNNSRLPTEVEWERAARGGQEGLVFPWGNTVVSYRDTHFEVSASAPSADTASSTDTAARKKEKVHRANIFHGKFPASNTADDGYEFAAPVDAFGPQNDFGLYNMIGNVWEWVSDYWVEPGQALSAEESDSIPNIDTLKYNKRPLNTERVRRGGSFLCHKSYCYRYRNAARTKNTPDSAAFNQGFRCARDAN